MFGMPSHGWAIAASVVVFLILLGGCAYWASLAFGEGGVGKRSSLMAKWRRPSTLLIILAFVIFMYARSLTRFSVIILIAAFVLRHWENDSLRDDDITEADVDKARDEVLGAESTRRDKHADDDEID